MRVLLGLTVLAMLLIAGCGGTANMDTNMNSNSGFDGFNMGSTSPGAVANTVASSFWNITQLQTAPRFEELRESVEKTSTGDVVVKEINYESPAAADETLGIFAYYAYPASKQNLKLPAIVWVHGGASVSNRQAVVEWASRGYACLSMDLPGKGGPYRESSRSDGPDMNDENIFTVKPSPKNSYLYLCVNAVCRGISLLGDRKEVDAARIGVLGYSWGGVITLLVNGIDKRVAAACPVFGAGYIPDESCWVTGQLAKLSAQEIKVWREHFDPSSYLASQHGKTLFVSATNDAYYPLRSFVKTWQGAQCEKAACLALNKNHELDDVASANIVRWFDWALRSGSPFPTMSAKVEGDALTAKASGKRPVVRVQLVTADNADFAKAAWTATDMTGSNGSWTAPAPKPDVPRFVVATDDNGAAVIGEVRLL